MKSTPDQKDRKKLTDKGRSILHKGADWALAKTEVQPKEKAIEKRAAALPDWARRAAAVGFGTPSIQWALETLRADPDLPLPLFEFSIRNQKDSWKGKLGSDPVLVFTSYRNLEWKCRNGSELRLDQRPGQIRSVASEVSLRLRSSAINGLGAGEDIFFDDHRLPANRRWECAWILHRANGPAVIKYDGSKLYYHDDQLDRSDGPAVITSRGDKKWYRHGRLHRADGPAIETHHPENRKEYWIDGKLHNPDGPAVIRPDGSQEWYQHGHAHREDGPAVISPDGSEEYWLDGKRHRDHGPAVVNSAGSEEYWCRGERHRLDGPAVTNASGQLWYRHGRLHRESGPAIEYVDRRREYHRRKEYWLDGVRYKNRYRWKRELLRRKKEQRRR